MGTIPPEIEDATVQLDATGQVKSWPAGVPFLITIVPESIELLGKTQDGGGEDEIRIMTYGRGKNGCVSGETCCGSEMQNCAWYAEYSGVTNQDDLASVNNKRCECPFSNKDDPRCEGTTAATSAFGKKSIDNCEEAIWFMGWGSWLDSSIFPWTAMSDKVHVKAGLGEIRNFAKRHRILYRGVSRWIMLLEEDALASDRSNALTLHKQRVDTYYNLFEKTPHLHSLELEYTFGYDEQMFQKVVNSIKWLDIEGFAREHLKPFCVSRTDFVSAVEAVQDADAKEAGKIVAVGVAKSLTKKAVKAAWKAGYEANKTQGEIRMELFNKNVPGGLAANAAFEDFLNEQEFCLADGFFSNKATYVVKFKLVRMGVEEAKEAAKAASTEVALLPMAILLLAVVFASA